MNDNAVNLLYKRGYELRHFFHIDPHIKNFHLKKIFAQKLNITIIHNRFEFSSLFINL